MDRMTYRAEDQHGKLTDHIYFRIEYNHYKYQYADTKIKYDLILKRLAEYEDTGMTPDDINDMQFK